MNAWLRWDWHLGRKKKAGGLTTRCETQVMKMYPRSIKAGAESESRTVATLRSAAKRPSCKILISVGLSGDKESVLTAIDVANGAVDLDRDSALA